MTTEIFVLAQNVTEEEAFVYAVVGAAIPVAIVAGIVNGLALRHRPSGPTTRSRVRVSWFARGTAPTRPERGD